MKRKQISIDYGAWSVLVQAKELALKDGIGFPSHSDAIRSLGQRCKIVPEVDIIKAEE